MNNRYFQEMIRIGTAYRRSLENKGYKVTEPIFSKGKSDAFKYWSISQQYQCEDILVDELPEESNLTDFLHAFREAQIKSIVITGNALRNIDLLLTHKCRIGEKCSTRRIIENGFPEKEVIKGIRVYL